MSLNWVVGRYRADGFVWHVRGSEYSTSHENWLWGDAFRKGGSLFLDIGANVGSWTLRASPHFTSVMAFEPDPTANRILRINIARNKLNNVRVFRLALSDKSGVVTLPTINPRNPSRGKLYEVGTVTIDRLNVTPSLVKIDTEGNEGPILRGAPLTLEKKPTVVVETHSLKSLLLCRELLESYDYSIREITRLNRRGVSQSWLLCN